MVGKRARLFFLDELKWVEVLDLAGKTRGKAFRVKLLDVGGAAAPTHQTGPRFLNRFPNWRNQTDACNYNATCQYYSSLKVIRGR